jgi:hypothetical protein
VAQVPRPDARPRGERHRLPPAGPEPVGVSRVGIRRPFVNATSAHPATFGAEIEGQIRAINAGSGPSDDHVSCAADSGRASRVGSPKRDLWYTEPKLNGWRDNGETRRERPRVGRLRSPRTAAQSGRGTLVVLASIPESSPPTYEQRRATLEALLPGDLVFDGDSSRAVPCGAVVLSPARRVDSQATRSRITAMWRVSRFERVRHRSVMSSSKLPNTPLPSVLLPYQNRDNLALSPRV